MATAASIVRIPCHIIQSIAATAAMSLTLDTATGGKLPLGLGGQTEAQPCNDIQLGNKVLAVPHRCAHADALPFSPLVTEQHE